MGNNQNQNTIQLKIKPKSPLDQILRICAGRILTKLNDNEPPKLKAEVRQIKQEVERGHGGRLDFRT